MSKERWEEIIQCKKRFLEDPQEDPRDCPHMRLEVAESWIRSRSMGVNPYAPLVGQQLTPEEFEQIRTENKLLLEMAVLLFQTFRDLVSSSSYALYLFDRNGTALLQEGRFGTMKPPVEYASIIDQMKADINAVGQAGVGWHHNLECTVWKEENIGTNAHVLSMRLKRPIQLVGPEHYCLALHNIVASAAPILDENGDILATLVLGQPLTSFPWDQNIRRLCSHTFGLITTMAVAIEAHLKLKKSYDHLEALDNSLKIVNRQLELANIRLKSTNDDLTLAYDTLEATLASIDEGIVTVSPSGQILRINPAGARMLRLKAEEIQDRNISEFLGGNSRLMSLVRSGKIVNHIEESLFLGNEEHSYLVNIYPVVDKNAQQIDSAVLRFMQSEKVNALVTNRSGAVASYSFADIIGESDAIKKAIEKGKKFASSRENILLIGESGTGKELFAHAIHREYRPHGPFIAVNCAALPRELIESELFGYEGGSFTGAMRTGRPGKIELADGGTLFLDEIGDMPFELQAVLLRVLEDKQVMRIGGQRYKKVDFRVIAGTNKNLFKMVKEKLFREDLFYRLSVLQITLPPLRERENDVEDLINYFVRNYCQKTGTAIPQISPAALRLIREYDWPGNVRQLENAIIYAVNTAQGGIIEPENLPDIVHGSMSLGLEETAGAADRMEDVLSLTNLEIRAIKKALLHTSNNIPVAADLLGISKSTLYRKLKEYNIDY